MSAIRERTVLCIIDLPKKLTSRRNLRVHFSSYGEITNVSVNKDNRSAMVTFSSHFGAQAAKTQGQRYEDKTLNIYWSESSSVDQRAKEDYRRKPNAAALDTETIWEDDEKETFGVESVKIKKVEDDRKSAENLIQRHLKPTGIKKRLGTLLKAAEGNKTKVTMSQKSPTKPGKVSPKMLLSSKRSLLTLVNKQKLVRKAGETVHSVVNKQKKSIKVDDQSSKGVTPMAERTDLKMKLALLDERDKLIRTKTKLDSNIKTAVAIRGTCPDMCPERERIMRQFSLSVATYEMVPGTYDMDENKAVKEYTRSSADQEVPLPHDLRPEPVLSMTMNYLITNIINKVDSPEVNKAVWYSFCWNRLRSVRKDIILQQLCDMETVKIVEQCARFHISCYDHMWGAEVSGFDDKINTQNLIDCLQTLRHMYEDLAKRNVNCPNEPEFYAYLILLKLKSGDVMWEYQQYSLEIQLSSEVQFAIQAYMAFKNNMYSKFFSLVKKGSYLTSCLLQRHFNEVRTQALKTMLKAYCLPGKTVGLSSAFIVHSLKFDSQSNALQFCDIDEFDLKIYCEKNEDDVYISDSSFLIREKRLPIANAVVGENTPLPVYAPRHVHSSFDEFGKLKHWLYEKEEPEIVSNEDISNSIEDSYCSEESLYFDEYESEASVVNTLEVAIQQPAFKFSLSPTNTSRAAENIFNKSVFSEVSEDNKTTRQINVEPSPFFNTNSTTFSPFSFSSNAQLVSNSDACKMEPDIDKELVWGNNKTEVSVDKHHPLNRQNSMVTHSQQPGLKQPFFFQSGFTDKQGTSYQEKRDENKPSTINQDLDSVFSFTSKTVKANENYPYTQHSLYDNKSEVSLFTYDSSAKDLSNRAKLFDSTSNVTDTSITKEALSCQDHLKEDREALTLVDNNKEAVKAALLDKLLKEKLEEEKMRMEEIKREAEEKIRKEIEEKKIMQLLRKNLRERMKTINARSYARLWKEKIAKLKRTRADFPTLVQLSVNDHLSQWGTVNSVPVCSILQRAKDKRNLTGITSQLLRSGITDSCKYIGLDLAETLAQSAVKSMRKNNMKPIFWKLAVSVPWPTTTSLELTVFNQLMRRWCKHSFYKEPDLHVGSVESALTTLGIPVNICIHFAESLHSSQNIKAMNALLFVVLNEAESEKMCLQRLRSLLLCQMRSEGISISVINIGGVKYERVLKKKLEELQEENRIAHWSIRSWSGPTSIYESLTFLAENVIVSPHISASSLEVLVKQVSEEFFDALSSGQHSLFGLAEAVKNPNYVIYLYNTCLTKLESLLTSSRLEKYFNFAEEFKDCISLNESGGPELLCGKQFGDVYKSAISKKMNSLKLKEFMKWPPTSTSRLVKSLKSFCFEEVHDVNIFPQIIRMLDIPDDVNLSEYLQQISWLNIIEVLVQSHIRNYFFAKDINQRFFVIFNKNDIQRLIQEQWWLKLPSIVLNTRFDVSKKAE